MLIKYIPDGSLQLYPIATVDNDEKRTAPKLFGSVLFYIKLGLQVAVLVNKIGSFIYIYILRHEFL